MSRVDGWMVWAMEGWMNGGIDENPRKIQLLKCGSVNDTEPEHYRYRLFMFLLQSY